MGAKAEIRREMMAIFVGDEGGWERKGKRIEGRLGRLDHGYRVLFVQLRWDGRPMLATVSGLLDPEPVSSGEIYVDRAESCQGDRNLASLRYVRLTSPRYLLHASRTNNVLPVFQ